MFQRDYVMRQIQQMVQVIERVLLLKRENRMQEAVDVVSDSMNELFGMRIPELVALDAEDLLALCRDGKVMRGEKAIALADLLEEEAHSRADLDEPDMARKAVGAALTLYEAAIEGGDAALPFDIYDRTERLKEWLRADASPG